MNNSKYNEIVEAVSNFFASQNDPDYHDVYDVWLDVLADYEQHIYDALNIKVD